MEDQILMGLPDSFAPDNLLLNPLALAIEKHENDEVDVKPNVEIPKIEIKEEEDRELNLDVKKEDEIKTEIGSEPSVSLPEKRLRRKPIKYEDESNEKAMLRRKSKRFKEEPIKIKKERKSNSEIDHSEEIKVEPKIEIDLDQLENPHPEVLRTAKCPICRDEIERNEVELKDHYKQEHTGKRLRFSSLFFENKHACDICGKQFKTPSILKDHMEIHNNYFFCPIDNHSTKKLIDHIIHMGIHSETSTFQCLTCDFATPDILQINDHYNNHKEARKYWCDPCKKSFPMLSHFQEHDNFHTGLNPFDCEFCGKCFMYSRYLHAHKVAFHKEEMNCVNINQCPICHKQYKHRNSLKLHMNYHTGNFAICELCGKTLCSKEKLKFHLRIHTGYKPFSCQFCGKSFTKKPILVEHIRVHTGEKPYFCDYCTKAFSQRSSLVIHMRGHTGEKPYICEFCSKAYAAKAMLTVHLKHCKSLFSSSNLEF